MVGKLRLELKLEVPQTSVLPLHYKPHLPFLFSLVKWKSQAVIFIELQN